MKRFNIVLAALSVLILSGCGGGSSSSFVENYQRISPEVKQVMVLTSPAFERYNSYKIYKGSRLTGMNGAKYYISNTGSEAMQSTLNLGFSEVIGADEPFIIVNDAPDSADHSGGVVFAYDPSGVNDSFISGGSIGFVGGNLLMYRTLSLSENVGASDTDRGGHYELRPEDADVFARYESGRGVTTFAVGSGSSLSFVAYDEDSYLPRDVKPSGTVLRLSRKVNTFSGITRY